MRLHCSLRGGRLAVTLSRIRLSRWAFIASAPAIRVSVLPICRGDEREARCLKDAQSDWGRYIELADRHNEPGLFTTFAAYEYSPPLERSGKHHRNVIFNGENLPPYAISSLDVTNAIDLWRGLEASCTEDCDFLTIPHNMNKGWGLFYSRHTWDGGYLQ